MNSGEVLMVTRSFWEAQTVGSTPTTATTTYVFKTCIQNKIIEMQSNLL
jgi:hypothetical protein